MKLSIKGLAFSFGLLWAGCVLLAGASNLVWPGYANAFLAIPKSIYPGYAQVSGFGGVIVGALYALADGAIGGAILAWLYNGFASGKSGATQ